ncbi:hypothetical protein AYX22_12465 [Arthrobacter sp. D5-1]|nr:hypothetical protein AYX22_12465 [Arthrobacter sp. D5-1]
MAWAEVEGAGTVPGCAVDPVLEVQPVSAIVTATDSDNAAPRIFAAPVDLPPGVVPLLIT